MPQFQYSPRWQDFADLLDKDPGEFYAVMEDRERQLEAYLNFGEETYTPEINSTGTPPTIGDTGFEFGAFCLIGRECIFQGEIRFGGAGITNGTGNYLIPLPVRPRVWTQAGSNVIIQVGAGTFADASAGAAGLYNGGLQVNFAVSTTEFYVCLEGMFWGATTPVALATTDAFRFRGSYMIDED